MEQGDFAVGPYWEARSSSADTGVGTVAASTHLDLCAALLVAQYGKRWFEDGALSLYFLNVVAAGERVQALCGIPRQDRQVAVRVRREDSLEIAAGTASVADHAASALRTRDLHPTDPGRLRILRGIVPGAVPGEWERTLDGTRQLERYRAGAISDPLTWYDQSSPWGGAIAAPSTAVEFLWGAAVTALTPRLGESVGLFGAIEVAHRAGPLMLGEVYRITAEVVAVSESPKTESLWLDALALRRGVPAASLRIMLRYMKASSPLHA